MTRRLASAPGTRQASGTTSNGNRTAASDRARTDTPSTAPSAEPPSRPTCCRAARSASSTTAAPAEGGKRLGHERGIGLEQHRVARRRCAAATRPTVRPPSRRPASPISSTVTLPDEAHQRVAVARSVRRPTNDARREHAGKGRRVLRGADRCARVARSHRAGCSRGHRPGCRPGRGRRGRRRAPARAGRCCGRSRSGRRAPASTMSRASSNQNRGAAPRGPAALTADRSSGAAIDRRLRSPRFPPPDRRPTPRNRRGAGAHRRRSRIFSRIHSAATPSVHWIFLPSSRPRAR